MHCERGGGGGGGGVEVLAAACRAVVLVKVGTSWGSGVLLTSQGHVLTSAHVVQPHVQAGVGGWAEQLGGTEAAGTGGGFGPARGVRPRLKPGLVVSVRTHEGSEHRARLLFFSTGAVDVAMLQIVGVEPGTVPCGVGDFLVPRAPGVPPPGEPVYVLGHALFPPSTRLGPTICSGIVSKLATQGARGVALIQSTACVFRGHSGGALVDGRGHLVGLVTSNAKHASGQIIPDLNFSIPVRLLAPLISFANGSGHAMACDAVAAADPALAQLWALETDSVPPQEREEQAQQVDRVQQFKQSLGDALAPTLTHGAKKAAHPPARL